MLVSSAKSKHSASLMKNQLLNKIIFSVRYLEIWLYTIFLKKISRKQEVLKLLCNFQSRMIVIRERPAWNLTFSCVVRIFSFRSLYFMFSLVMGFFFFNWRLLLSVFNSRAIFVVRLTKMARDEGIIQFIKHRWEFLTYNLLVNIATFKVPCFCHRF